MVGIINKVTCICRYIKQSGSMIFGNQEKVESVVYRAKDLKTSQRKLARKLVEKLDTEEISISSRLMGWEVHSTKRISCLKKIQNHRAIVAGLSLPMLIESYASCFSMNTFYE